MIQAALHLTAATLLALVLGPRTPLTVALALVLALLPDLDTPKSLVGSLLKRISVPIERRVGHRTATHSLVALALVAGLAYLLVPGSWSLLTAAYASHLILDLLIGIQGIRLFWPSPLFLSLTDWPDHGRAPRVLLGLLLPVTLIAALWPQLDIYTAPVLATMAHANPIATGVSTKAAPPSVRLRFALPAGVNLSALQVHAGDIITEGQTLAAWPATEPTPHPVATTPPALTPPPTPPMPTIESDAVGELDAARVELQSLTMAQEARRSALIAEQQRDLADLQRGLADLQRGIDALGSQQELEQQAAQMSTDQAGQALIDAQDAQGLATESAAAQRAAERVHAAEAALHKAELAQERLTTEQAAVLQQAEADLVIAEADLDALPDQQEQALVRLDAEHKAAMMLASNRVERASAQVEQDQLAHEHAQESAAVTATALISAHQAAIEATVVAHRLAMTATAAAIPTPAPNSIVSRAAGKVVSVVAEEQDGQLIVTLEVMP
jgi:membrane-bound metal-dependent hydrolase YbcI (DUF457 family)